MPAIELSLPSSPRFAVCSSRVSFGSADDKNGSGFFGSTSIRTPAYSGPRYPAPYVHVPPQQSPVGLPSTTNSGKFWFSVPSPYVTHDPSVGNPPPSRGWRPFWNVSCAPWSLCTVQSDRTTAMSSAQCCPMFLNQSPTTSPHSPYAAYPVFSGISTLRGE